MVPPLAVGKLNKIEFLAPHDKMPLYIPILSSKLTLWSVLLYSAWLNY